MARSGRDIIELVVELILVGMLVPIGLAYIGGAGSTYVVIGGVNQTMAQWVDPTIVSIFTIIIPIVAIVGLITRFTRRS